MITIILNMFYFNAAQKKFKYISQYHLCRYLNVFNKIEWDQIVINKYMKYVGRYYMYAL